MHQIKEKIIMIVHASIKAGNYKLRTGINVDVTACELAPVILNVGERQRSLPITQDPLAILGIASTVIQGNQDETARLTLPSLAAIEVFLSLKEFARPKEQLVLNGITHLLSGTMVGSENIYGPDVYDFERTEVEIPEQYRSGYRAHMELSKFSSRQAEARAQGALLRAPKINHSKYWKMFPDFPALYASVLQPGRRSYLVSANQDSIIPGLSFLLMEREV